MPSPRLIVRFLRVVLQLSKGAVLMWHVGGECRSAHAARRRAVGVRRWHRGLCRALDIEIEVRGEPVPHALLVANHVSWLDIPVLGSQGPIGFVSKAEVRHWPLIGWLAHRAGTFFIARGANRTADLIPQLAARLRAGDHLAIFPEGTTTDGTRLGRFHPRLFAAGQQEGVLVQPVALRYGTDTALDPVAPFVGADALLPHLLRVLARPGLVARVEFLRPLDGNGLSRRQISEQCRDSIAHALGLPRDPETARTPPPTAPSTPPRHTPSGTNAAPSPSPSLDEAA